jgi:hypothetical protein
MTHHVNAYLAILLLAKTETLNRRDYHRLRSWLAHNAIVTGQVDLTKEFLAYLQHVWINTPRTWETNL